MTLEPVLGGDDTIRRNFSKIEDLYTQLQAIRTRLDTLEALGLTKRTRGVTAIAVTAAVSGSVLGVAHGLGTTPNQIQVTALNSGPGIAVATIAAFTATTFDVGVRFSDGIARTVTINVGWEAIA